MSETSECKTRPRKTIRRSAAVAIGILVIILVIATLVGAFAYYTPTIHDKENTITSLNSKIASLENQLSDQNKTISALNSQVSQLRSNDTDLQTQLDGNETTLKQTQATIADLYHHLYNVEFQNVPLVTPNYNFSPPITMYQALIIALEGEGWNASALIQDNRTVSVELIYVEFHRTPTNAGFDVLHEVTQPPTDYSPLKINYTTYRYTWYITIHHVPPPCMVSFNYQVDAATGEIVAVNPSATCLPTG